LVERQLELALHARREHLIIRIKEAQEVAAAENRVSERNRNKWDQPGGCCNVPSVPWPCARGERAVSRDPPCGRRMKRVTGAFLITSTGDSHSDVPLCRGRNPTASTLSTQQRAKPHVASNSGEPSSERSSCTHTSRGRYVCASMLQPSKVPGFKHPAQ
jgi:hypothetical protein